MAITMVIGNRSEIAASLFAPSYTMASVIANEFTEATGQLYLAALAEVGLLCSASRWRSTSLRGSWFGAWANCRRAAAVNLGSATYVRRHLVDRVVRGLCVLAPSWR